MDIQSFIQSGLLETYVLGQCSAEERQLVERMVAQHPEVRAELSAIEQALEGYAAANAVKPPEWMKGRIEEVIENQSVPTTSTPAPPPAKFPASGFWQIATALFAILCIYFLYRNNQLTAEKESLQTRVSELQAQLDDCALRNKQTEKLRQAVVLLRDRDTRPVPLDNGKGTTYAYYNSVRREAALDLAGLPAPAPGKYFQFWAIVGGKPVSMGMVDLQSFSGWQMLPYLDQAAALAVSQEDNPNGNATPTQVIMVGNVPTG
ncbi:MAG: anti-sigma factor [Lewinellaceae bacterium]|nr:anti-sigma factor [Lewinellaceae bacterium]